eukprot:2861489-Alexandrium_andersonii.AAC.1
MSPWQCARGARRACDPPAATSSACPASAAPAWSGDYSGVATSVRAEPRTEKATRTALGCSCDAVVGED